MRPISQQNSFDNLLSSLYTVMSNGTNPISKFILHRGYSRCVHKTNVHHCLNHPLCHETRSIPPLKHHWFVNQLICACCFLCSSSGPRAVQASCRINNMCKLANFSNNDARGMEFRSFDHAENDEPSAGGFVDLPKI